MSTTKPWFGPESAEALADVYAVYTAHVDVAAIVRAAAGEDPSFAAGAAMMAPHWTPEAAQEKREIFTNALLGGEWGPYEESLRREAVLYAQHSVENWQLIARAIAREVTPRLVDALESQPRRLAAALLVLHELLERARGVIGAAYYQHRVAMTRESEERSKRIIASSMVGVWVLDSEGKSVFMNERLAAMIGVSVEEALRIPVTDLIEKEVDGELSQRLEQRRSGKSGSYERRFKRKNGEVGWAIVESSPLFDANGQFEGILSMVTDITERRSAEEALRASEEAISRLREERAVEARFRDLLEAAPDAMVIVDEARRITLVNAQTERLFGYTRDELLGEPVERLVPEGFPSFETATCPAAGTHAEGPLLPDIFGRRKDGTEVPIEIAVGPLSTDKGLLLSSAIRNITARRRIENALRVSNRELEAFSYSVAHDLRGPLRGINGFARILLDDHAKALDPEGRDCLHHICRGAERMGELIDALLSLAHISRVHLGPQRTSISTLAHLAAAEAAATQANHPPGRTLPEVFIAEDLEAWIDPAMARLLVQNLVSNAWKFTAKCGGPRIEVRKSSDGNGFFVRDNGTGFDMAHASKLFAPFARLHLVREYPGTGMGLATARRIVERHGGRIWAEAQVGQGATFFVELPPQP